MLSEKEFYILRSIAISSSKLTQREIQEITSYSLGTINKFINGLIEKNYINENYAITIEGEHILEKYRVNNAIILAAGISSDNNPIIKNIPKGLYIVRGELLIERIIKQLHDAGIKKIFVIVGYKMDQFFYLEKKFNVTLIPNIEYLSRNNTGSIYCAKEVLGNSYVIPNDVYFERNVFSKYEYKSYYAVMYDDSKSKKTFVTVDNSNRIINIYKNNDNGLVMLGHCYLKTDFCNKYLKFLENVYYKHETKRMFWEEIIYPHINEVALYAKKYEKGIIREFNELAELKEFDDQFINNINCDIYNLICKIFNATKSEITNIQPINENSIDILFKFKVRNNDFIFCYPINKSLPVFNYNNVAINNRLAKLYGMNDSFVYENELGYQISLDTQPIVDFDIDKYVEFITKMQSVDTVSSQIFDYREKINDIFDKFDENQNLRLQKFSDIRERIFSILTKIENDNWTKKFSHNNILKNKFRLCDGSLTLTDWKFSGINDIGYDIASISCLFSNNMYLRDDIIKKFIDLSHETRMHLYECQAVTCYYRFLLGIYYSDFENEFANNIYSNWKSTIFYLENSEIYSKMKLNEFLTNDQVHYVEEKIKEKFLSVIPLSGGVTNSTYKLTSCSGKVYAVRIPGKGTNEYINRKYEMNNILKINDMKIMPKVTCADYETGILIMDYIEDSLPCTMKDFYDNKVLSNVCYLLTAIHSSSIKFENEFDIPATQDMYRNHFKNIGGKTPEILLQNEKKMDKWMKYLFKKYPKILVPCHIDPKLNNFLKKDKQLFLIDWEYSGMSDLYFELANFTLTNNLNNEEEEIFIKTYCRVSSIKFIKEKYLLYKFATDYLWIYWHLIKCQQNSMIEYNEMSWNKRLKRALNVISIIEKGELNL